MVRAIKEVCWSALKHLQICTIGSTEKEFGSSGFLSHRYPLADSVPPWLQLEEFKMSLNWRHEGARACFHLHNRVNVLRIAQRGVDKSTSSRFSTKFESALPRRSLQFHCILNLTVPRPLSPLRHISSISGPLIYLGHT